MKDTTKEEVQEVQEVKNINVINSSSSSQQTERNEEEEFLKILSEVPGYKIKENNDRELYKSIKRFYPQKNILEITLDWKFKNQDVSSLDNPRGSLLRWFSAAPVKNENKNIELKVDNQVEKTKELLNKIEENKKTSSSPLDFNLEQAIDYIKSLPKELKNSFFAKELRKKYRIEV
jgi:hypothetical protein